ncbi:MAG: hypothetical protein WCX89_14190 [Acidithiobacillus thiooxidans]
MSFKLKQVAIGQIYLDPKNPRHDPIHNEPEIIAHLLSKGKVRNLAKDIAQRGGTSPLDRLAVVAHEKIPNAYTVVEGNRRICALKLLSDPEKAPTERERSFFRGLAENLNLPVALEVAEFKSHKDAATWMSLRHEGEQDGVGTVAWDADQKTRFSEGYGTRKNPNILARSLITYARDHNIITPEQASLLLTKTITTLTRFLSSPVFRKMLGLTDNKSLIINVPKEEFDVAIKRFLIDALSPETSPVHSRTDKKEREEYAERLRTEGEAPTTRGSDVLDLSETPKPNTGTEVQSQKRTNPRDNQAPDKRSSVIPKTFKATIRNPVLKRIYDELKRLPIQENFAFAGTYLIRAFLEQMTTQFLEKSGKGYSPGTELHKKILRMAEILKSDHGFTELSVKVLNTMGNDRHSRYSPETIGSFVHGHAIPTAENVIKLWDSLQEITEFVLKQLE